MADIKKFEDIEIWQKSREFTRMIYAISSTENFNKDFGLRDQMRRASVSVLSNISEGFERGGNKEFIHFLSIAKGSCGEIRAQLYVALDQNYIDENDFKCILEKACTLSKMISGFIKYLKDSPLKGNKYK
ncbi:MAG TPA: four helix bundle protein [bacterium]|nr:four helix bundle protein [bacterium]